MSMPNDTIATLALLKDVSDAQIWIEYWCSGLWWWPLTCSSYSSYYCESSSHCMCLSVLASRLKSDQFFWLLPSLSLWTQSVHCFVHFIAKARTEASKLYSFSSVRLINHYFKFTFRKFTLPVLQQECSCVKFHDDWDLWGKDTWGFTNLMKRLCMHVSCFVCAKDFFIWIYRVSYIWPLVKSQQCVLPFIFMRAKLCIFLNVW